MSQERISFPEIPSSRLERAFLQKLGIIEIMPSEMPHIQDIRWHAYLCRTTLRLGDNGDYLFDPQHHLHPEQVTPNQTETLKHILVHRYTRKSESDLVQLFPQVDPVLLSGILRRLDQSPKARKSLVQSLNDSDPHKLQLVYSYLSSNRLSPEFDSQKPDCLILTHMKSSDPIQATMNETGKTSSSFFKARLTNFVSRLITGQFSPYIGASLVMTELEQSGYFGLMKPFDYHDIDSLISQYKDHPPKYAFLTGLLSFELKDVISCCQKLRQIGVIPVCGGLGPTIDENAFLMASKAIVFKGEIEDAGPKLIETLEKLPDLNIPTLITRQQLGLPSRVDYLHYYSPEKQKSGWLSSFLHNKHLMEQNFQLGSRSFDPPWMFFDSVLYNHSCPHGCDFCSTVLAIGTSPRRKPLETLRLELEATEARKVFLVDQNLTAHYPRYETETEYLQNIISLFNLFKQTDVSAFYQTEARFFDWLKKQNPDLIRLIGQETLCVLMGLEQPGNIKGAETKTLNSYESAVEMTNALGIVSIGTCVIGLDPSLTREDWLKFTHKIRPTTLGPFAKMSIPGSPSVPTTLLNDSHYLERYEQKFDPEDQQLCDDVAKEYYRLLPIFSRLINFVGRKPDRLALAVALNSALWSVYSSGTNIKNFFKNSR